MRDRNPGHIAGIDVITRVLTIGSALALLTCIAACVLWARSYWIEDFLDLDSRAHHMAVWSRYGRLSIWTDRYERPPAPPPRFTARSAAEFPRWPDGNSGTLGFVFDYGKQRPSRFTAIALPWWSVGLTCGCCGAIPILRRLRVQRRRAKGQCLQCGYDLRASKDRCPECGTPIAPASG